MEENRIQIKFNNPDIDGTPRPHLITLDQETPIEGTAETADGNMHTWHKWLCIDNQYFMASPSLDGMLKMIPEKLGKVIKIEKIANPKEGGYPFFQVNGLNKDQLIAQANVEVKLGDIEATMPQTIPAQPVSTSGSLDRLEQKLDKVISILNSMKPEEVIPF